MSSFWKYMFDSNVMQRHDIEDLRRSSRVASRHARRRSSDAADRLDELEDEVGELRLFSHALLALLQETGALDPKRLREKILELDASDGTADGRYDPQPMPDEKAGPPAPVSRKRKSR